MLFARFDTHSLYSTMVIILIGNGISSFFILSRIISSSLPFLFFTLIEDVIASSEMYRLYKCIKKERHSFYQIVGLGKHKIKLLTWYTWFVEEVSL